VVPTGTFANSVGVLGESTTEWEETRLEALRPRLLPTAQRALDDLPGLREAARIPTSLRGLHTQNRFRYGLKGV